MHTGGGPRGLIRVVGPQQFPLKLYLLQRSVWEEIWPVALACLPPWSGEKRPYWPHPSLAHAMARRPELSSRTLKRPH